METHGCGDVDLLIRTGGDQRISNFLIWQNAYAEIVFTKTKWPDFSSDEFNRHYHNFLNVERRFGSLGQVDSLAKSSERAEGQKQLYQHI
jgi:undecaprenyl diphosphate synthase